MIPHHVQISSCFTELSSTCLANGFSKHWQRVQQGDTCAYVAFLFSTYFQDSKRDAHCLMQKDKDVILQNQTTSLN